LTQTLPTRPTDSPAPRLRRLLSLAVFATLVALIPLTAIPYGTVDPWWVSLFEATVFSLAALWAIEGALSGNWVSPEHSVVLPFALLALYAFFQSWTVSYDPYETRLAALQIAALTLALALLIRYASSERRVRVLVYAVVSVGAASALFGILRQATQRDEVGFLLARLPRSSGYAQFINKNHFAYLAEMALGLSLGLAAGLGLARQRTLVYAAVALLLWSALVLSNSRGGIIAMLCQVVLLVATYGITRRGRGTAAGRDARGWGDGDPPQSPPQRRAELPPVIRILLAATLLLLIVVGMVWLGGDPLADRMSSVRDEVAASSSSGGGDASRTGRAEIWKATWGMFADHPLAGVGVGGYWIAVSGYHQGSGALVPQQAHNDYLELLASGGVVGFLLLPIFIYLLLMRARVRLRRGTPFARAVALGALIGLFGVAVHSLFDFGLHVTVNALVFVTLVAVVAAEHEPGRARPKNWS
jgi:O-antigen ligase